MGLYGNSNIAGWYFDKFYTCAVSELTNFAQNDNVFVGRFILNTDEYGIQRVYQKVIQDNGLNYKYIATISLDADILKNVTVAWKEF